MVLYGTDDDMIHSVSVCLSTGISKNLIISISYYYAASPE